MRRADRLFQIVGLLGRRRFMTAAQLAEALEVSTRTIYRDVLDLIGSGVPILGEAGVGYQLSPSYRLPPMTFSADELEALVLGTRMVEAWGDSSLRQAARSIVDKVNAVVGDSDRDQLTGSALFSLRFGAQREASKHLGELRQAINQRRRIRFRYQSEQGEGTERMVRPLGLYFWGRAWTLAAYCELRADFRNFRSDRIEDIELLDGFELVSPCTLEDYERAMQASGEEAPAEVVTLPGVVG
jgi:predicted DNA-binding transcriptional regulator YafY